MVPADRESLTSRIGFSHYLRGTDHSANIKCRVEYIHLKSVLELVGKICSVTLSVSKTLTCGSNEAKKDNRPTLFMCIICVLKMLSGPQGKKILVADVRERSDEASI